MRASAIEEKEKEKERERERKRERERRFEKERKVDEEGTKIFLITPRASPIDDPPRELHFLRWVALVVAPLPAEKPNFPAVFHA